MSTCHPHHSAGAVGGIVFFSLQEFGAMARSLVIQLGVILRFVLFPASDPYNIVSLLKAASDLPAEPCKFLSYYKLSRFGL